MAFRARSPQALERRVTALKGSGYEIGLDGWRSRPRPGVAFRDPDGHKVEIYYETEWYKAPPELRPALKNQAMRFPARGVNVRRLDHLNCLAWTSRPTAFSSRTIWAAASPSNRNERRNGSGHVADGLQQELRFRLHARPYRPRAAVFTTSPTPSIPVKTFCSAADIFSKTASSSKPARTNTPSSKLFFLYVYEPAATAWKWPTPAPRLILAPDWKPIVWSEEERKKGQAWGLKTIESFHTYGTPPVDVDRS